MNRELVIEFARVTEAAALNCVKWIGRLEKNAADGAAVEAMRAMFDTVPVDGTVVIGEGEMDEAPMLYIGEKVGAGGPEVDIAVDPLEGTNLTAKDQPGAIAVLAVAEAGGLLHAPDMYMDKIIVGPKAKGAIDIDKSVEENLRSVAQALGKEVGDLSVCVLDRDRHRHIMQAIKALGAKVRLISDGDVSPALTVAMEGDLDMVIGIGGAPEGVLAAAAVKCLGGDMQARLAPEDDDQVRRAEGMGLAPVDRVLSLQDLVPGNDLFFVATGVTDGALLKGVQDRGSYQGTHTIVLRNRTHTIRLIESLYQKAENIEG